MCKQVSTNLFKNKFSYSLFVNKSYIYIYNVCMHKQYLKVKIPEELICDKTSSTKR